MPVNPHIPRERPEHPASMVMVRVGGRDYPQRTVPNCHTCQHPNRAFIENQLVAGISYVAIVRELEGTPEGGMGHPSAEALANHVKNGHLVSPAHVRRRIIDARAEAIGMAIEDEVSLIDHITANDVILQRGYERMVSGEIEPTMADLANAIAFRARVEATSADGYDQEAWSQALHAYMEVAKQFIPAEQWNRYGQMIDAHPLMRAINQRLTQPAQDAGEDIVPGQTEERARALES